MSMTSNKNTVEAAVLLALLQAKGERPAIGYASAICSITFRSEVAL